MATEKKVAAVAAKKPPKPASIYRKPIEEKAFQKKYLRYIEQEKDRALLQASFDLVEGRYALKGDLDRPTMVRLNKLAKAIKGNRGFVKSGPLVMAAIVVSALVVFVLFFMNPVLERSIERALESTFGARADVTRFRLSPWNLEVSMASITVADKDDPMTNLFETGRIELKMNPASLIRGRVYIQEASAAAIALGTPRNVSGELKGAVAAPAKPAAGPTVASLAAASSSLVDLENFDAMALLEREKDKLGTTAAYASAAAAYDAAAARWKDRVETSKKSVSELGASTKGVLQINPKSFRSIDDVNKAIAELKAVADKAKTTADEAKTVVAGVKADADQAAALVKAAREAVDKDVAYLKSFIDPKSGAARGMIEPVIKDMLTNKTQRYIYYGQRGLEVVNKLKASAAESSAEKKKLASATRGRDVIFPSAALPRFRLGLLASNFKAADQDWNIELREVTSEPDLVSDPTTLLVTMKRGSVQAKANVVADLRSSSAEAFAVNATGTRLPIDLGNSLSGIGLGGFTGRADASLELHGEKKGGVTADAEIDVRDAAASEAKGTLGKAIAEALASVDAVELTVGYEKPKNEDGKFSLDTNLDKIIAKVVKDLAERYARQAADKLEKAVRDYVAKELEGKFVSKEQLDLLLAAAKGDDAAAASLRKAVDDKRAELEGRAKAIADEATAKVKAEADKAAAAAKAEADAAAAKAQAEAKKAQDAAAKKAQDAAAEALKKIEKPKLKF